jgi:hypothetical protein
MKTFSQIPSLFFLFVLLIGVRTELSATDIEGRSTSLPFDLVNGLLIVEAEINGTVGHFIFDTGCPHLVLNEKVNEPKNEVSTAMGTSYSSEKYINRLKIGQMAISNFTAWTMDLKPLLKGIDREIDGIIGWSYFRYGVVYIDFENKMIHITSDRHIDLGPKYQYHIVQTSIEWVGQDLAVIPLVIDGKEEYFVLDTGAPLSLIHKEYTLNTNFVAEKSVSIADVTVRKGQFKFDQVAHLGTRSNGQAIDGILSVSSLNAAKVIVDGAKNKVYILWSLKDIANLD